jgi:hypothetical protein
MSKNTLATVKCQIHPAVNPTPAIVISGNAVRIANAIVHDYLTSKVVLEDAEIRRTLPNIPIDNNC